ncbi:HesA/MoeB/ThiF family protein [Vibrio fluvialis]|uniref:HesA/MoeB/ThiF family protein n=1 Tax=Vibrio fluvialis TaxID=676 RepID=UPI00215D3D56|nr:HesA/MoeB/ThiF family protein [Vibrio fluvialis]MCR9301110.1 HesA/MoeB/ThiF family protein [Vibrio fluvialis]
MLSDEQFVRYQRQISLTEIGERGQQKLLNGRVLVVGCGGLGTAAAQYLAAAGVGHLVIADDDCVELSNLHRQLAYRVTQLKQPKVVALAQTLAAINPECRVRTVQRRMDSNVLSLEVSQADIVLDCCDNLETRHAINAACFSARKPLISGSAIGWEGQLVAFDFAHQPLGCYRCLVPDDVTPTSGRCTDLGVMGPVVGSIGNLQALMAMQWLLQLNNFQSHQVMRFDGLTMQWQKWRLLNDPDCSVCSASQSDHHQTTNLASPINEDVL